MNVAAREATAGSVQRRMRKFWFYRLTDGTIFGSQGCTDHDGLEHRVRSDAAERGEGVLEHDGEIDLRHDRVDVATGKLIDPLDHAFAADLDAKFERILRLFPMLREPVPPVPLPPRQHGTQRFSVAAFWEDFAQRAASGEWKLRAASDDVEGQVGPFHGIGTCLAPVLPGGEMQWIDPRLPAQDGDIVIVKLDALELQRIRERGRDKPDWMAMYGGEANPLATKLLKAFAGEYWLVTNGSMFPLGRNRILGVLRHCLVDGSPAYTVSNISPNAATVISEVTDSSSSLINGGGVVAQLAVPAQGLSEGYLLTVLATLDVWITNFGGGTPIFEIEINGNGSLLATSQSSVPSATTSPGQRITLQATASIDIADEAGSGVIAQLAWTGAQPAGTAEVRNITLRAEQIKR